MMLEFSFWKTAPPQTTNGIYELRKYNLKVNIIYLKNEGGYLTFTRFSPVICLNGNIIGIYINGWENIFVLLFKSFRRKGLECRSQFCEPVGAWFSQLGNLHTVQHMWTYP